MLSRLCLDQVCFKRDPVLPGRGEKCPDFKQTQNTFYKEVTVYLASRVSSPSRFLLRPTSHVTDP